MAALVALAATSAGIHAWETSKESSGVDETHLNEEKLALTKSSSTPDYPHKRHKGSSWTSRLENTVQQAHVDGAPKTNPANDSTPASLPPIMTRGRAREQQRQETMDRGWQSFKDWSSIQGNPSPYGTYRKDRYRPLPISIEGDNPYDWPDTNIAGTYSNAPKYAAMHTGYRSGRDPRYKGGYARSGRNMEEDIKYGLSADDFVQRWNQVSSPYY